MVPKSCAVSRSSGHKVVHSQTEHQPSRKGAKSAGRTAFLLGYDRQNQEYMGARRHAGFTGPVLWEEVFLGQVARERCSVLVVVRLLDVCLVSRFGIE